MNPAGYLVQRTDRKRLEELAKLFYRNGGALAAVNDYNSSVSVKEPVKGFCLHMMDTHLSNGKRLQSADSAGVLMDNVLRVTKNSGQFKAMSRMNSLHIENVNYLLEKLTKKEEERKESEAVMPEQD